MHLLHKMSTYLQIDLQNTINMMNLYMGDTSMLYKGAIQIYFLPYLFYLVLPRGMPLLFYNIYIIIYISYFLGTLSPAS